MEVFVQNSPIHCIFRLPSVTDRFNPNIQFPDRICYSDTLPLYNISIKESCETKPPPLCPAPAPVQDKDVVDETEEYDHLDYNRSVNDLSENYCSGIYV